MHLQTESPCIAPLLWDRGANNMSQDVAAEDVLEDILYRTGRGVLENNDAIFLSSIALPLLQETVDGQRVFTSEAEVCAMLAGVRAYMTENGYVDLARTVVSAEFLDDKTISGTHVSLLMDKDGNSTRPPYPVHSMVRLTGSEWRLTSSIYAILDAPEHNTALLPGSLLSPNVNAT